VTKDLTAVQFVNAYTGFCAGFGAILRTTTGGAIWYTSSSAESGMYSALSFSDPWNGIVVGWQTSILSTTDGGVTWVKGRKYFPEYFHGVSYSRSGMVTIVGGGAIDPARILHSSDRGHTWQDQISPAQRRLNAIYFRDRHNATIVGEGGTILHSSNAGITWAEETLSRPTTVLLGRNHPNPVSSVTSIPFTLTVPGHVSLTVHDVLGRKVATLLDERQQAGRHSISFNAGGLSPGVYFYTLRTWMGSESRSMLLLQR
jgi:photosystem II stability/assembly factor-like uncharacterized protein